jgi:hypothetical protein
VILAIGGEGRGGQHYEGVLVVVVVWAASQVVAEVRTVEAEVVAKAEVEDRLAKVSAEVILRIVHALAA